MTLAASFDPTPFVPLLASARYPPHFFGVSPSYMRYLCSSLTLTYLYTLRYQQPQFYLYSIYSCALFTRLV